MAFNTIEYLMNNNTSFIAHQTTHDRDYLINLIRNHPQKKMILANSLESLLTIDKLFCLKIIYDIEEYQVLTLMLFKDFPSFIFNQTVIFNLLSHTKWGKEYIINNLSNIAKNSDDNLKVIINYALINFKDNMPLIKKLSLNANLHSRYLFMKTLIQYYPEKLSEVYDDISLYLTSYTYQENEQMSFMPDKMTNEDVSNLAVTFLKKNINYKMWLKIKNFIITNYPKNNLAKELLDYNFEIRGDEHDPSHHNEITEFKKDADTYFKTSANYQLSILNNYSKLISKTLIDDLKNDLHYFYQDNKLDNNIYKIYSYELNKKLNELVNKYLSISKCHDFRFLGKGTTCSTYRVGDYAIKLVATKWSYENIICPNLYLIAKNYEEIYLRNSQNIVVAGIEVQKCLTKQAHFISHELLDCFYQELGRLGYYSTDTIVRGQCGDNAMFLDSYMDADTKNPDVLPDWFKENPLFLVDRDRIYKLENEHPYQLSSGY